MKIKPDTLLGAFATKGSFSVATDTPLGKAIEDLDKHKEKLASLVKRNLDFVRKIGDPYKKNLSKAIREGKDSKTGLSHKFGQFFRGHGFRTKDEYLESVAKMVDQCCETIPD